MPPPRGDRTRTAGFSRMLEQVAAEERGAVAQLAELPRQPLLVAGGWDRYGRLVAGVARVAAHPPAAEDFEVVVRWHGKECRVRGGVTERVEATAGQQSAMDARVRQWLQSVGAAAGIYAGELVVSLQPCRLQPRHGARPRLLVELEGADPRAAKLQM